MDIGVSLVEAYLRLCGYLTLTEFGVVGPGPQGIFETITDVDVMGIRLPGGVPADDGEGPYARLLLIDDPVLQLQPGLVDVIIGEVKQGEAQFNPGLRRHEVLNALIQKVRWLYGEPAEAIVAALISHHTRMSPGRSGGQIRTRLVAFGRSPVCGLNVISHAHIIEEIIDFLAGLGETYHPLLFQEAAPAMLNLLIKNGFRLSAPQSEEIVPPPSGSPPPPSPGR